MLACKIDGAAKVIRDSLLDVIAIVVKVFFNNAKINESYFKVFLAFNKALINIAISLDFINDRWIANKDVVWFQVIVNVA